MFLHSDMVLEIVYEKTNQLCCCLILFKTLVFALISISQQLMCELSAGKQASESNGLGIKSHFCLLTGSHLYSTEIGKKSKSPTFYRLLPQL